MGNEFYTVTFIASFVLLFLLISVFRERISIYYVLLFASILIANFGYMQMSDAQDLEMAVYANQVTYLGTSFCPFFLLMCIADLTKQKIGRALQVFYILYGTVIFTLVSTIGATSLYYKSVSIEQVNGVTRLIKEYGPLHAISPLYYLIVAVMGCVYIIRAVRNNEEVSYIICVGVTILGFCVTGTYLFEHVFAKTTNEYIPAVYVLAQIGVFILLGRVSLHDVTAISTAAMVDSMTYGFMMFDSKGRFLGSDVAAKHWFDELKFLSVDRRIRSENTELLKQIGAWVRNEDERDVVYFEEDGLIIEARHDILRQGRKWAVHCLYLRDDTKQQLYMRLVEKNNENLEHNVEGKTEKISQIRNDIIKSMASIVENRDNNTGGHIARTSDVVRIFVNYLREENKFDFLTHDFAKRIIKAAPLHDFGKIAVPDVILNKPGKFTDEEYEVMKTHSAKGAAIVEKILQNADDSRFQQVAVNVAHFHHEKWDGRGYPEGISGNDIPFEARVMALADVFDALVSKRVYKESLSYDKAFAIIEDSCGSHFDPVLCVEFLKCRPLLEELYNSYED